MFTNPGAAARACAGAIDVVMNRCIWRGLNTVCT